ncbi:unnamed protein product [Prunus armeniaca]|uniref:Uncharacterized protein n=1 Tax=Prunus armeniaca TaxID=36596 RepID=A0A6J5WPU2_PRUAR|nr:unnamed protein product [Prunus armeniaca]CAB4302047.1 unnamed protein product [Prunus armeniaca]
MPLSLRKPCAFSLVLMVSHTPASNWEGGYWVLDFSVVALSAPEEHSLSITYLNKKSMKTNDYLNNKREDTEI